MTKLRKTFYVLAATLLAVCISAFVLMTLDAAETRQHLEGFLTNVDMSDGIDAGEADRIAWAYFLGFVGACGGPDPGQLVGEEWVVPASFGFGGRPMEAPIRINVKTGAVGQVGSPSFRNYMSFKIYLLWGIPLRKVTAYFEEFYLSHWASPDGAR